MALPRAPRWGLARHGWNTAGRALLEWQRGKAGTIEHMNYVLKDELAAGVYPSNKFGANTAWMWSQVLTHNLLELLKATALDAEHRAARPKRLRFASRLLPHRPLYRVSVPLVLDPPSPPQLDERRRERTRQHAIEQLQALGFEVPLAPMEPAARTLLFHPMRLPRV